MKQYEHLVVRVEVDDAAVRKGRNGYFNSGIIEHTAETKICKNKFRSIPTRKIRKSTIPKVLEQARTTMLQGSNKVENPTR